MMEKKIIFQFTFRMINKVKPSNLASSPSVVYLETHLLTIKASKFIVHIPLLF